MVNCHCRDGQKASSGAYSPTVVVEASYLQIIEGEAKSHSVVADSGNDATRRSCGE
jgi:hypothetical protein